MKSKRLARNRTAFTKGSWAENPKRRTSQLTLWLFLGVVGLSSVAVVRNLSLPVNAKPRVAERVQRGVSKTQVPTFDELSAMSGEELETQDIAVLNLRAATSLPGSPQFDITDYLKTLDKWARQVEHETLRNHHRYSETPEKFENSEAFFSMLMLVTVLQQDFGVRYNPDRIVTSQ